MTPFLPLRTVTLSLAALTVLDLLISFFNGTLAGTLLGLLLAYGVGRAYQRLFGPALRERPAVLIGALVIAAAGLLALPGHPWLPAALSATLLLFLLGDTPAEWLEANLPAALRQSPQDSSDQGPK